MDFDVPQYEESSDEETEYPNKALKVVGEAQTQIWVLYEKFKSRAYLYFRLFKAFT